MEESTTTSPIHFILEALNSNNLDLVDFAVTQFTNILVTNVKKHLQLKGYTNFEKELSASVSFDFLPAGSVEKLINQYLSTLSLPISTMNELKIRIRILEGIRQAIQFYPGFSYHRRAIQSSFATSKCFEYLFLTLELMCQDGQFLGKNKSVLLMEIIKTFTCLLQQNDAFKMELAKTDGYARLCITILEIEVSISIELFDCLFGMLVDCLTWDIEVSIIVNKYIIAMLMDLFTVMEPNLQILLIDRMIYLASVCDQNKWVLCNSSIISKLLKSPVPSVASDQYVQKTMSLLELLGSYSVTISDVRVLIRSLCFDTIIEEPLIANSSNASINDKKANETSSNYLASYQVDLLEVLYKIAQRGDNNSFFQFKGEGSGIQIHGLDAFPKSGYSFFTWIRLDNQNLLKKSKFGDEPQEEKHTLFQFIDKRGTNLEVYFKNEYLNISYTNSSNKLEAISPNYKFALKRWYFIHIQHSFIKSSWGFGQPEILVYVDNNLCANVQFDYPAFHQPSLISLIGCSVSPMFMGFESKEKVESDFLIHSFQGQMATVYFTSGKLSATQLTSIYELGKENSSIFLSPESKGIVTASNSKLACYIDSELFSNLIFVFNPRASRGSICLNLVTHNNPTCPPDRITASIYSITYKIEKCYTLSLQNAIHSLGGIEVLFPMLLKLDNLEALSTHGGPLDAQDHYFVRKGAGHSFFTLLGALLNNHAENQQSLLDNDSILVIASLLKQIHPRHLTVPLYQSLVSLASVIQNNPQIEYLLFCNILFNLRIWMYASFETLAYILDLIKNLTESRKSYFSQKFGIQFFIDMLRICLYYEPDAYSMPEKHKLFNISRPENTLHLYQLRSILIDGIILFLKGKVTSEDILILSRHLIYTKDLLHCFEILNGIFDLFKSEAGVPFLKQFLLSKGYETLCSLLKKGDNKIRATIYDLFSFFVNHPIIPEKWKMKIQSGDILSLVYQDPQQVPIDDLFYISLLKFSLEYESNEPFSSLDKKLSLETINILPKVKNYHILISIINLLSLPDTDEKLKERVLSDLSFLCKHSLELCHKFQTSDYFLIFIFRLISTNLDDLQLQTLGHDNISLELNETFNLHGFNLLPKVSKSSNLVIILLCIIIENTLGTHSEFNLGYKTLKDLVFHWWCTPILYNLDKDSVKNRHSTCSSNPSIYTLPKCSPMLHLIQCLLTELCLKLTRSLMMDNFNFSNLDDQWIDNVLNISTLIMSIIFHNRELEDTLFCKVWSEVKKLMENTFIETNVMEFGFNKSLEVLRRLADPNLPLLEIVTSEDLIYQLPNNPWEESLELTIALLNFLDQLDQILGLQSIQSNNTKLRNSYYSKVYNSYKNPCKSMLRILISGLSMADTKIIGMVKSHFQLFFERHNPLFCNGKGSEHYICPFSNECYELTFPMFGYIHEAFNKVKLETLNEPFESHPIVSMYFNLLQTNWIILNNYEIDLSEFELNCVIWESALNSFIKFIESNEWTLVYDKKFSPSIKEKEENDFKNFSIIAKSVAQNINHVLKRLRNEIKEEEKSHHKIHDILEKATSTLKSMESNRVAGMEIEIKSIQHKIHKVWVTKLQEMTLEHSVWLFDQYGLQNHWKLDFAENYSRMRRRLTLNYEFNKHEDASAKRDKTPMKEMQPFSQWKRSSSIVSYLQKATSRAERIKEHIHTLDNPSSHNDRQSEELVLLTEDASEDPDWSIIYDTNYNLNNSNDKFIVEIECNLVYLLASIQGKLKLTNNHLYFIINRNWMAEELNNPHSIAMIDWDIIKDHKWELNEIREIYLRRYMLKQSGLELFFINQTSYFFNFNNNEERQLIINNLKQLNLINLIRFYESNPNDLIKELNLMERWQRYEISNFDYLMQLNSLAGRSYNDLSQYFIFPWILKDYESNELDLSNPDSYRDLSKPIGALDQQHLKQSIQMYNDFEDPNGIVKKFHYGTHYSSAGSAAFYLLRLEPFTSIHIALQSGKFDHADRQFISLESCWKSCLKTVGDVKELIPEFFYLPEFLKNSNKFDLGRTQSGLIVDDVILPKWAKSPEHFIQLHREALESDYVSQHLHEWIDLIFGYKQTGEEAIKSFNTFYYLTYEGAIDLDSITNPIEKKSIEEQIYYFGQTPTQIFSTPHPPRHKEILTKIPARIYLSDPYKWQIKDQGYRTYLYKLPCETFAYIAIVPYLKSLNSSMNTNQFSNTKDRFIITVDRKGNLGYHKLLTNNDNLNSKNISNQHKNNDSTHNNEIELDLENSPFSLEINKNSKAHFLIPSPFAHNLKLGSKNFLALPDGHHILSSGHWDNTIKLINIPAERIVASLGGHGDVVTCIALSEDAKSFVTGSKASNVFSWYFDLEKSNSSKMTPGLLKRRQTRVSRNSFDGDPTQLKKGKSNSNFNLLNGKIPFNSSCKPDLTFYGHHDMITCVAINVEHDLLVSGSRDGTCIIHSLRSGLFLRSLIPHINFIENVPIHFIKINADGLIIICSEIQSTFFFHVYTMNGTLLNSIELESGINDLQLSPDQHFVFVVTFSGTLEIYHIFSLKRVLSLNLPLVAHCIWFEPMWHLFFLGCSDGKLLAIDFHAL